MSDGFIQVPLSEVSNFLTGYFDGRTDESDKANSAFPKYKKENGGETDPIDMWYWLGYDWGLRPKSKLSVASLTGLKDVLSIDFDDLEEGK